MKRLHYRLSATMIAIVAVVGSTFYVIDRYSVRLYYEELSQRLNASLAMYIVNAEPLISRGEIHQQTLAELASRAMVINPTAEIYLLDLGGKILGHAVPPADVLVNRVDVSPIRQLLAESASLPIKGTDPRNPDTRKIFSAFPVTDQIETGTPVGYLYVVLGGAQYTDIASQVSRSDRQRMIAAAFVLLVLAAFVAGTLLFSFLTRRLRRLTTEVTAFTAGEFKPGSTIQSAETSRDEIDQLRDACHYMESTIQDQMSRLRENDRLRRELVTNISHDLRTPLAAMQGYIETLIVKNGALDSQTRSQHLEIARKHSVHLGRLIQDLFELAMLDASRVSPQFEEFSLIELIQDVIQEFELKAREARVSLQMELPAEAIPVYADISLIQRVLENLVSNALKYTPEGGAVSISAHRAASSVGVTVADTGPGISDQDLPHIFNRFYKAGPADGVAGAGSTGLGLAIAKRILELHGSEIVVASERSRGSVFRFDLPAHASAA